MVQDELTVPSAGSARILVAEDDTALAHFLKKGLEREGFGTDVFHDGEAAFNAICCGQYDLLSLDLNLPNLDGISLLQRLRPTRPRLPILVLTGRTQIEDRIRALDAGADDCISKPFSFFELAARIRALLRRNTGVVGRLLRVGDLTLDREEMWVERSGQRIELTAKEFAVLEYLMLNARRPVTRTMIMEAVWKAAYDPKSNLVDVYIKYVRDKVDQHFGTKLIRTVRSIGYALAEN